MENSNKNNENNNPKKQFLIKKDNDINDLLKVKETFENPNKFLVKDNKMIIGNLILNENKEKKLCKNKSKIKSFSFSDSYQIMHNRKEKKYKSHLCLKRKSYTQGQISTPPRKKSKIIPSSLSRPKTSSITKQNNYNINSNINNYLNNLRNYNEQDSEQIGIHYQKKTLSEILNILQKSRCREEQNKAIGTNNLMSKKAQKEIRQNFYDQEKILKHKIKLKNKSDFFSKLLSKKLKRKEDELLFNKIEEYRLKKQLIDCIENSKSMRDKFGDNYWIADLRRPKIQNEIRINYFNNGNKNNIPEKIIDYGDKDTEFINDPNRFKKNKYGKLLRNLSINNLILSNKGIKLPNFEKMNELEVIKGKKLLEQEYIGIIDGQYNINPDNRKFKLYKDPLEKKYKNIKEFTCGENYDRKYTGYKNQSYRINSTNQKIEINNSYKDRKVKKNGLFRSQSQIEESKNNKSKISYLKEALEILKNGNRKQSIKHLSSN